MSWQMLILRTVVTAGVGAITTAILSATIALTSERAATWLARQWYRLVTAGMPEDARERKREYAMSIIYEVRNDPTNLIRGRQGNQVAVLIVWTVVRGAGADITSWLEAGVPLRLLRGASHFQNRFSIIYIGFSIIGIMFMGITIIDMINAVSTGTMIMDVFVTITTTIALIVNYDQLKHAPRKSKGIPVSLGDDDADDMP